MPVSAVLAGVFGCPSVIASPHYITGGILCARTKGKATKGNMEVRESKKGEKMTADRGEMVAFSTYRIIE